MLIELKVSQFAIINHLELPFRPGLNILSGETGAGKSVVLKSLALLMGGKSEADTVRAGCDQAVIEGLFDLEQRPDVRQRLAEHGVSIEEDTLVVRRVINAQGKSKVYLNGQLSPLASLRETVTPLIAVTGHGNSDSVAPLIEMTGQHDNRDLQSRSYHLDLLDHYCGAMKLRHNYGTQFARLSTLNQEIARLENDSRTRTQRLDFLVYQRDEISALNLVAGEEETLETQVSRLRHSTRLVDFVGEAQAALYGDEDAVTVRLHQLLTRALELKAADPSLPERLQALQQAKTLIEDAVYELRDYSRSLLADPEELNRTEERLSQIRRLQKKFGGSVSEILGQLGEIEAEISRLESADSNLTSLQQEKEEILITLRKLADDLHVRRGNGATLLAQSVNDELADLNMKGVRFGVHIEALENLNATGTSEVEFTIQASKKDEPRPLAKFASGGELSRILLALKRTVGHSDLPRTYLFDEVDTGVSGQTAEKVGRKLKAIAAGQQVICVTHLPQVAAFADSHFVIEKGNGRGGVEMSVTPLNKTERVREIARLISGEKITSSSLEHARQLLNESAP
ncbi:MAG: DNA repair protein RecN [Bdellovibrionales bacterium]